MGEDVEWIWTDLAGGGGFADVQLSSTIVLIVSDNTFYSNNILKSDNSILYKLIYLFVAF